VLFINYMAAKSPVFGRFDRMLKIKFGFRSWKFESKFASTMDNRLDFGICGSSL
jgi:hypothetical protein